MTKVIEKEFALNDDAREVLIADEWVRLSEGQWMTLSLLLANRGRVVELGAQNVCRLRRRIGGRYIETISKRGYRFVVKR